MPPIYLLTYLCHWHFYANIKYMKKTIYLNHGKETIVDEEDYEYLCRYKWRYNTTGYATRSYRSISMSRVIMKASRGQYVDHINRDKLDNRKENLRLTSNQQNCWNTIRGKNSIGVSKTKNGEKWRAYYSNGKGQIFLGTFYDKKTAMKKYDETILKVRGVYAITNKMLGNY